MQWLKIFVRPIPAYRQNPKLPSSAGSLHKGDAKTDISDALWLQRLHEYSRASFRLKGEVAAMRAYLRQPERLLDYAASHFRQTMCLRPAFVVSESSRAGLGAKIAAALEHAHLLVFRPREASSDALQKLIDRAGPRPALSRSRRSWPSCRSRFASLPGLLL